MFKFLTAICFHRKLEIIRCHAAVEPALSEKDKAPWVDKHAVVNLVRCKRCEKVIPTELREPVLFGTVRQY